MNDIDKNILEIAQQDLLGLPFDEIDD